MPYNLDNLKNSFSRNLLEVASEPEFVRTEGRAKFATDKDENPVIKIAAGNFPLYYDLWAGLRNPATVGLHPAGLRDIWEFYANRRKKKIDETGRPTIFQVPRSFEYAQDNFKRAIIVSVMLPFSQNVVNSYVSQVIENKKGSSHTFARMYEDINKILDKTVSRVATELVENDNESVIIPMTGANVTALSTEAVPQTRQGISHGPSKGGNYPQKSIAALLGLGQFGISRLVFRDEIIDGKVQRYTGPIRSIVIFDKEDVLTDSADIMFPTDAWRSFLGKLYDFTNVDPEINQYRFCTHIPLNDAGCNRCVSACPSGAQPASTPLSSGEYTEQVLRQTHRFWDDKLQFDFGKCCDERGQMQTVFPEWSCARCVSVCADRGVRRQTAVNNFYSKMKELTRRNP